MSTRRTKIAALVTGCAVVAGGGYAAADALSSPASGSTSAQSAAALSTAVNGTSAAKVKKKGGALAALRRLPGQYGRYAYQTKKGQKVLAFERGTISSVSGKTVTVKAADGHTENWTLTGKSVIRESGKKTTDSALADGEHVVAAGPVTGSAQNVRVIVIRDKTAQKSAQKSTTTTAS